MLCPKCGDTPVSTVPAPQHTTVPFDFKATVCTPPPATCTIDVASMGTIDCPHSLLLPGPTVRPAPQHDTVPSARKAIVCPLPHATCTMGNTDSGMSHSPAELPPHATTARSAHAE